MLVAGPVHLPTPAAVRRIDVETAGEMYEAVLSRAGQCDIFIATAAVADYRPIDVQTSKMKKHEQALRLDMRRNPDILTAVASAANAPFTVGFAAETDDVERYAQEKRRAKGIDMIAANAVGAGLGFDVGDNALRVFWEGGGRELPRQPKATLAEGLIDLVAERYRLWKEKK
jgi:phosphopantothenoylcysteine decarboxylase/phosphopantothenate--cysteine ligase